MKLAVSSYSFWRWCTENKRSMEQAIDWLADEGVAAIEFAGLDPANAHRTQSRAATLRKHCETKKVRIVSYCTGAQLLVSPRQQKQAVAQLKKEVDIAAELGVRTMRHDVTTGFEAYKNYRGPRTFAQAVKIVTPAIREVADYAAERSIRTSVENHGFYMQASKRVEQLLKRVNHPNFGLTLDMGNFLCVNEEPVSAVERLGPYAIMAHVKDFHIRPKKDMPLKGWFATPTPIALRGAIVGHGQIDIPRQLRILKRHGYDGWLSLEFEGIEEPLSAIQQGLDYLRRHLK